MRERERERERERKDRLMGIRYSGVDRCSIDEYDATFHLVKMLLWNISDL